MVQANSLCVHCLPPQNLLKPPDPCSFYILPRSIWTSTFHLIPSDLSYIVLAWSLPCHCKTALFLFVHYTLLTACISVPSSLILHSEHYGKPATVEVDDELIKV